MDKSIQKYYCYIIPTVQTLGYVNQKYPSSLPDTKLPKDIPQQVFDADFAGDLA